MRHTADSVRIRPFGACRAGQSARGRAVAGRGNGVGGAVRAGITPAAAGALPRCGRPCSVPGTGWPLTLASHSSPWRAPPRGRRSCAWGSPRLSQGCRGSDGNQGRPCASSGLGPRRQQMARTHRPVLTLKQALPGLHELVLEAPDISADVHPRGEQNRRHRNQRPENPQPG